MGRPVRARLCGLALAIVVLAGCGSDDHARAQAYAASAEQYVRRGRDAAAVIEYRNAVRLAPDFSTAYAGLAAALTRLGRLDEAARVQEAGERTVAGRPLPDDEASLRDVVTAHPRHVGARLALARHLLARGAPQEAEAHLRAALAVAPSRELPNRALAALLVTSDPPRRQEAELYLRRAAAAIPQRHRSRLALADFFLAQQRWREAGSALEEAATQAELADAVALRRVVLRDATGDRAGAREDLAVLLGTRPSAEAWALRAEIAWRDGDREGAADAARQALILDPGQRSADRLLEAARWQQVRPQR